MITDDSKNWVLRISIVSSRHTLEWMERASNMHGGSGSFSKGDAVPEMLQSFEKCSTYDCSKLQVSREFKTAAALQRWANSSLRKHVKNFEMIKKKGRYGIALQLCVESYEEKPAYFTASPELIAICAKLGFGLHFVSS